MGESKPLPTPALGLLGLDLTGGAGAALLADITASHGPALASMSERLLRAFTIDSPTAPGLCLVGAETGRGGEARFGLAGTGPSLTAALASCLAEGAERLSQVERAGDVEATLGVAAAAGRLQAQVAERVAELAARLHAASSDAPVFDWVGATCLATGDEVLVPADWCLRRTTDGPLRIPGAALSTGAAAGATRDEAAVRAILEAIERDAAALWWRGGRRGRGLPLDHPAAMVAARAIAELRRDGQTRRSWLLDLTGDLGIPVMAAISAAADERGLAFGLAARLDPGDAVAAAMLEMAQMEVAVQIVGLKRAQGGDGALNAVDRQHLLRSTALAADTCALLLPAALAKPLSHAAGTAPEEPLRLLRARLMAAGIDVALVDLTRPDIGVPVAMALAPALQGLPSAWVSKRLAATIAATGGGDRWTGGVPLL